MYLFFVSQRKNFYGQAKQIDKACGVLLVVNSVSAESGQIFAVKAIGAFHSCRNSGAFVKLHPYHTGNIFLSYIYKSVQRFSKGQEPLSVINKISIF